MLDWALLHTTCGIMSTLFPPLGLQILVCKMDQVTLGSLLEDFSPSEFSWIGSFQAVGKASSKSSRSAEFQVI